MLPGYNGAEGSLTTGNKLWFSVVPYFLIICHAVETMHLLELSRNLIFTLSLALPVLADDSLEEQIDRLFLHIEESGCRFIRNGKTYSPAETVRHIRRKYRHYRDEIDSIARFIELSASRSLISGKPYHVACSDAAPQETADWLASKAAELGSKE